MAKQYQEIVRALVLDIEGGLYPDGALFPRRSDLAMRFDVTRSTVDRAVRILVERGYLSSRRGAGTTVVRGAKAFRVACLSGSFSPMPVEQTARLEIAYLSYANLLRRSDREQLKGFDGIIWNMPDSDALEWCRQLPVGLPSIVINRQLDEFNYVSTDHRGAIYGLTVERLAEVPDALPVYLDLAETHDVVTQMRRDGFIDACREVERFYEILSMPASFDGRVEKLREMARTAGDRPLLIVSGTRSMTGAVCAWVRESKRHWQGDVYYSDFDNESGADVWGVRVTSFVQDYNTLNRMACERLQELMQKAVESVQVVVPPAFIHGDT